MNKKTISISSLPKELILEKYSEFEKGIKSDETRSMDKLAQSDKLLGLLFLTQLKSALENHPLSIEGGELPDFFKYIHTFHAKNVTTDEIHNAVRLLNSELNLLGYKAERLYGAKRLWLKLIPIR
jgi:hypothetical protein